MRIGIDARSVGNKVCGVSRVASCLISALSSIDIDNQYVVYVDWAVPDWNLGPNFTIRPTYCSRKNPFHDVKFYSVLKNDKLDAVHVLHSWLPGFIPDKTRSIVTIHDIFSVVDPDFFAKRKPFGLLYRYYFKYLTGRSVAMADAIITVSSYTKKELLKHFPQANGKIEVVPNASGLTGHICQGKQQKRIINDDYILFVGNCRSYKNVDALLYGFYMFLNKNNKTMVKLVIAGNDQCEEIKEKVREFELNEKVVFLFKPSDEELGNLYSHALTAIAPSKHEGFGIPVLEAMRFEIPVIVSDAEALVEVAGDAARIFKRDSPQGLACAIEQVVGSKELRDELVAKGRTRVKAFSWEASAYKLQNVYKNIST